MRKKILKKTLVVGLITAMSLSCFTGCGKKNEDASTEDVGTQSMADLQKKVENGEELSPLDQTAYDGNISAMMTGDLPDGWEYNDYSEEDYEKFVAETKFTIPDKTKISFTYDGNQVTYPFDYNIFSSTGWVVDDRSYLNEKAKSENYIDEAILINNKYPDWNINCCSHYGEDINGILGRESILNKYGIYNLLINKGSDKELPFCINNVNIFSASEQQLLDVLPDEGTFVYNYAPEDATVADKSIQYDITDDGKDTSFTAEFYIKDGHVVMFAIHAYPTQNNNQGE